MYEIAPFDAFQIPPLLVQVVIATAIGALIGLERERRPDRKYAGLRTMALLAGAGPVAAFLAAEAGHPAAIPVVLGVYLGLASALAIAVAYVRFSLHGEEFGFTTSVTVLMVAFLGVLVGFEFFVEATSIAIITAVVLAERDRLHGYAEGLTDEEVSDSLKLGALVFVLYPILPAEAVDPYGVVVLREVLLFAIFVLLIQFTSYVMMRTVGGSKGLAVTGLLAGGANSFAAAGVLANIGSRTRDALDPASFALLLATTSMIVRNVSIAGLLATEMAIVLVQLAIVLVALTLAIAVLLWYTGETHAEFEIDVGSPFSFRSAAKFSVAYVAILLVSVGAEATIGDAGLYAAALAGGLVSSAAVAVTAATVLNEGTVAIETAVGMVILGIVASLTAKLVLVEVTNRAMRRTAGIPMATVGLAGIAAFVVVSTGLPTVPMAIAGVAVLAGVTGAVAVLSVLEANALRGSEETS